MQDEPPPQLTHPRSWLLIFGPGAVIASLTIGSGELVFSSRAGALFGYHILGVFLAVCVLKWTLVFTTARHMVLTGAHPFERWARLPGPKGWLPMVFLLLAALSFPIWVAFHAGTVGTLIAALTGTAAWWQGAIHWLWGLLVLSIVGWLALAGGYQRLEKIQIAVVIAMLGVVAVSLILLSPDWIALLRGFVSPPPSGYPAWADAYPEVVKRPIWLELSTYVGVIGGSGYDYLAYVSFLKSKRWGQAGQAILTDHDLAVVNGDRDHALRGWVRAPLVDATLSFLVVLLFSAVFVACGAEVLQAKQQVPSGATLLTLQSSFVGGGVGWFKPVYFTGALLAMTGTLYATIEVAPTIVREGWIAIHGRAASANKDANIHRRATVGVILGGAAVLVGMFLYQRATAQTTAGVLVTLLTPANLFTGVLSCGLICALAIWSDFRFLPQGLRQNRLLVMINAVATIVFATLGIKAFFDLGPGKALAVFGGTILTGILIAGWLACRRRSLSEA